MKQHTVTRLSAVFLLDGRPKFPDQFSVVDTGNSLAFLEVANHQHTLTMPEYRVATHLENLEKSGNLKVVREKSGKMEKVREKSGETEICFSLQLTY